MLHVYIEEAVQGDQYILTDPGHRHHLKAVLRAQPGDAVSLFDRQGCTYRGVIRQITPLEIKIEIESRERVPSSPVHLTVACGLPKASGMDEIIDRLTQLGVDCIIPLVSARVLAVPDDPLKKLDRWKKIALSAAEQSQRSSLPEITAPASFKEALTLCSGFPLKLIPNLHHRPVPLASAVSGFKKGRIVVFIGPEGDFTPEEVQSAIQTGFVPITLGHNVLRVDTAAMAVTAFIRLALAEGRDDSN